MENHPSRNQKRNSHLFSPTFNLFGAEICVAVMQKEAKNFTNYFSLLDKLC